MAPSATLWFGGDVYPGRVTSSSAATPEAWAVRRSEIGYRNIAGITGAEPDMHPSKSRPLAATLSSRRRWSAPRNTDEAARSRPLVDAPVGRSGLVASAPLTRRRPPLPILATASWRPWRPRWSACPRNARIGDLGTPTGGWEPCPRNPRRHSRTGPCATKLQPASSLAAPALVPVRAVVRTSRATLTTPSACRTSVNAAFLQSTVPIATLCFARSNATSFMSARGIRHSGTGSSRTAISMSCSVAAPWAKVVAMAHPGGDVEIGGKVDRAAANLKIQRLGVIRVQLRQVKIRQRKWPRAAARRSTRHVRRRSRRYR